MRHNLGISQVMKALNIRLLAIPKPTMGSKCEITPAPRQH